MHDLGILRGPTGEAPRVRTWFARFVATTLGRGWLASARTAEPVDKNFVPSMGDR